MLLCLRQRSCHYCFATIRLYFISLTRSLIDPGDCFFMRGKLASAAVVMQRKAEILRQEPGLNHPPKQLFQGSEIIPNGPKWLRLSSIRPPHGCIWFITFTFPSHQRGVLTRKLLWRRWFIISLFSLPLYTVAGWESGCVCPATQSAATSSLQSASLLLLLHVF